MRAFLRRFAGKELVAATEATTRHTLAEQRWEWQAPLARKNGEIGRKLLQTLAARFRDVARD